MVSDLLMNEAFTNYARAKVEKSEDSGVESGHSLDNTSGTENICFQIINQDTDLQVSHL